MNATYAGSTEGRMSLPQYGHKRVTSLEDAVRRLATLAGYPDIAESVSKFDPSGVQRPRDTDQSVSDGIEVHGPVFGGLGDGVSDELLDGHDRPPSVGRGVVSTDDSTLGGSGVSGAEDRPSVSPAADAPRLIRADEIALVIDPKHFIDELNRLFHDRPPRTGSRSPSPATDVHSSLGGAWLGGVEARPASASTTGSDDEQEKATREANYIEWAIHAMDLLDDIVARLERLEDQTIIHSVGSVEAPVASASAAGESSPAPHGELPRAVGYGAGELDSYMRGMSDGIIGKKPWAPDVAYTYGYTDGQMLRHNCVKATK